MSMWLERGRHFYWGNILENSTRKTKKEKEEWQNGYENETWVFSAGL